MNTTTRPRSFVAFLPLLLILAACNRGPSDPVQMSIDGRDVTQVVVVEVPRTIESPVGFTAETLEQRYHQKLDLRAGAFVGQIGALNEAVGKTRCEPTAERTDLRTGIIFFDPAGKRIRSIYYGFNPSVGEIDGTHCRLDPALYRWVRKHLPE